MRRGVERADLGSRRILYWRLGLGKLVGGLSMGELVGNKQICINLLQCANPLLWHCEIVGCEIPGPF